MTCARKNAVASNPMTATTMIPASLPRPNRNVRSSTFIPDSCPPPDFHGVAVSLPVAGIAEDSNKDGGASVPTPAP